MEKEKFTEIENIVKELNEELNPFFMELQKLKEDFLEINEENKSRPLRPLLFHLTKTARRHNLNKRADIFGTKREYKLGTNHQGIGYEVFYSSQLTTLCGENRYYGSRAEQFLRNILFDDDLVMELTTTIKKSNQKLFLKVIKILKKYNVKKSLEELKDNIFSSIKVDINDGLKVDIELSAYSISLDIINEKIGDVRNLQIDYEEGFRPSLIHGKSKDKILSNISNMRFRDLDLEDLKSCFVLSQNVEVLKDAVNKKIQELEQIRENYKKETEELNDLLEPYLTLEKL